MRLSLNNNNGAFVTSEVIPLEMLNCGEWADVADIAGEPGVVGRIAEMGVQVGSRLRVLRSGTPCLLQVGDARLSVRGDWAMQIYVRPRPSK